MNGWRPVWFRITEKSGRVVVGGVQGNGGVLSAKPEHRERVLGKFRVLVERATEGLEDWADRPLPVYEPLPGCVQVYPLYGRCGPDSDGPKEIVDLRGATVELA